MSIWSHLQGRKQLRLFPGIALVPHNQETSGPTFEPVSQEKHSQATITSYYISYYITKTNKKNCDLLGTKISSLGEIVKLTHYKAVYIYK